MSAAEIASVNTKFNIFLHNPFQMSVHATIQTAYKPIAPWIEMI